MSQLKNMTTADKIIILNEVKKDWSSYKYSWTLEKVEELERMIISEVEELGETTK